jgi:indole-3-glycerol phosphate synthase
VVVYFGLSRAITSQNSRSLPAIIAEVKCYSPLLGDLRGDRRIEDIVSAYETCGAVGISYITADMFRGSLGVLRSICDMTDLPVLRKDFVTSCEQLEETASAGASAVLLIARTLGEGTAELVDVARSLGLDTLVEVHNSEDIPHAISSNTTMIGINNRDITAFERDGGTVSVTESIACLIDTDELLVSESGIDTASDLARALAHTNAALIGTSLMRAPSIEQKFEEFMGVGPC